MLAKLRRENYVLTRRHLPRWASRLSHWRPSAFLRSLGMVVALSAVIGLVAAGAPAVSASAHPTPSTPRPASVGPGLRQAPSSISVSQAQVCGKVAAKAGFSYNNYISTNAGSYPVIVVAVAVALAESSCQGNIYLCNPSLAVGYYPPVSCPAGTTSYDRGLWQINSYYHSEVSDSCAFQVQCNADAAFNISGGGYHWGQWATYNSGAWANYISLSEQAAYNITFLLENHGTGTCLGADSAQPYNGGLIFQWACEPTNSYEQWTVVGTTGHIPILKNIGTGTCLGADSAQVYNGGKIFQWSCSTTNSYEQWWFYGSGQLNTNGNANAGVHNLGTGTTCLATDSAQPYNGGLIFQWACNQINTYEQWN